MSARADLCEIGRALRVLLKPGAIAELRVPNAGRAGTVSGYFDNQEALAQEAARWSGRAPGVYITVNPVAPALLARAANRVQPRAQQTTSDRNILRLHWFLIDFDPVRPAGISSTGAEHDAALIMAQAVREALREMGWPDPIFADSGNGAHLLYLIDLPNEPASTTLLKRSLGALSLRFDDEVVHVDVTTSNAARLCKVYGTLAAKGDATAHRPHRLARLVAVPSSLTVVAVERLAHLAAMAPEPSKDDVRRNWRGPSFDLEEWLARHADRLRVVRHGPWNGGERWILNPCPWNPDHTNSAAFIVQFSSGAIAAGCHHNGCAGRDWAILRDLIEPDRREPSARTTLGDRASSVWSCALSAPDFVAASGEELDFLEDRLLARGSITEWFSPRGLGKTHVAHALAVKHALAGRRVLLIDRDNSRREVKRRLLAWGADQTPTLKVLTRDYAPALTDSAAWAAFPFRDYDLIIIDSIDAATEGVGEQDSAKPARAFAPLLDIAHREAGPAILLLGNVIKSGAHGRGSGIVEDRGDIVYEVRDATGFQPTGAKPWWCELPPAGRADWAERAGRRRRRETHRLAFIPTKYRIGEEPDPFVLEVDLTTEPWSVRDVTADLQAVGQAVRAAVDAERQATREKAVAAVLNEVARQTASGQPGLGKKAAEALLQAHGLTSRAARDLLRREGRWSLRPDPKDQRKIIIGPGPRESGERAPASAGSESTRLERRPEGSDAGTRRQNGCPDSTGTNAVPDAGSANREMRAPSSTIPPAEGTELEL